MSKPDITEFWILLKFVAILAIFRLIQRTFFVNSWFVPVVEAVHGLTFTLIACYGCLATVQLLEKIYYSFRMHERRSEQRYNENSEISIKDGNQKITARMINVSLHGMCVRTPYPLGRAIVDFENACNLHGNRGYVRWTRRLSGNLYETGFLME